MEVNKILTMIDLRMKRLCNKKVPSPREVEENDDNEDDNDAEIGSFTADGQPTSKCIVSGQGGKKRKANVFLQQQLQSNLDCLSATVVVRYGDRKSTRLNSSHVD